MIALYHERWEIELGFDELKTGVLAREEAVRSQSPAAVEQELWGLLLAYNLVRLEMERIAAAIKVEPTRISFVGALALVRHTFAFLGDRRLNLGTIPSKLTRVRT